MNLVKKISYNIIAILPAAGIGSRMRIKFPKQYYMLHGKTLLEHTVDLLLYNNKIDKIIIVIHPNDYKFYNLKLYKNSRINVVTGGKTRADSVMAALNYIENTRWVLIHDAVRPFLNKKDLLNLLNITKIHSPIIGGILATPVRDTIKCISLDNKLVYHTIERSNLWHALTPQLFNFNLFKKCLSQALNNGININDDSSAVEYCGYKPLLIPCYYNNIKITYPEDLILANFYFAQNYKEN